MRTSEPRLPAMRLSASGAFGLVALMGAAACGRTETKVRDTAAADTPHAITTPDTAAAPRVVPYDPSAPGPMRSGDEPIRAATPAPSSAQAPTPATQSPPVSKSANSSKPAAPAATPPAAKLPIDSVGDPAAIVRDYYTAIRAHDFLRAYRMWASSGQSGVRSYAQFEAGFDSTETVDAKVGPPGRVEGAAGSRFVTVPLEIDARLRNGTRQSFTGTYTLRRVVVPGAPASQRRWHLYAANIRQVR